METQKYETTESASRGARGNRRVLSGTRGLVAGAGAGAALLGLFCAFGEAGAAEWTPDDSDLFGLCTVYEDVQGDGEGDWCQAWEFLITQSQYTDSGDVLDAYVDTISYKLQFARFDAWAAGESQSGEPVYKRFLMVNAAESPSFLQRSTSGGTNGYAERIKVGAGNRDKLSKPYFESAWSSCLLSSNEYYFGDTWYHYPVEFTGMLDSHQQLFCWGSENATPQIVRSFDSSDNAETNGATLLAGGKYGNDDFSGGYRLSCKEDLVPDPNFRLAGYSPHTSAPQTTVSYTTTIGLSLNRTVFLTAWLAAPQVGVGTSVSTSTSRTISPDYTAVEADYYDGGTGETGVGSWLRVDYFGTREYDSLVNRGDTGVSRNAADLPQDWYTTPESSVGYVGAVWEITGTERLDYTPNLAYGAMASFAGVRVFPKDCEQTYAATFSAPYVTKTYTVDFDGIMAANDVPDEESVEASIIAPTFDGIETKTYAGEDEIYATLLFTDQSTNESWFEIQERMVVREVTGDSDTVGVEIEGEWSAVTNVTASTSTRPSTGTQYRYSVPTKERWRTQQSISTDEEMLTASESPYYDHVLQYRIRAATSDGLESDWSATKTFTVQEGIVEPEPVETSLEAPTVSGFAGEYVDETSVSITMQFVDNSVNETSYQLEERGVSTKDGQTFTFTFIGDLLSFDAEDGEGTGSIQTISHSLPYKYRLWNYLDQPDMNPYWIDPEYKTYMAYRIRAVDAEGETSGYSNWFAVRIAEGGSTEATKLDLSDNLPAPTVLEIATSSNDEREVTAEVTFRDNSNAETGFEIQQRAAVSQDGATYIYSDGYSSGTMYTEYWNTYLKSWNSVLAGWSQTFTDTITEKDLVSYSLDSNLADLWYEPGYDRYIAYRVRATNDSGASDWSDYEYLIVSDVWAPDVAPRVLEVSLNESEATSDTEVLSTPQEVGVDVSQKLNVSIVDNTENESRFVVRVEIVDSSGTSWSYQDFEFDNGTAIVGATIGSQMLEVDLSNYADWTAREDYGYDQRIVSYEGLRVSARAENDYGSSDWSEPVEVEIVHVETPQLSSASFAGDDALTITVGNFDADANYDVEIRWFNSNGDLVSATDGEATLIDDGDGEFHVDLENGRADYLSGRIEVQVRAAKSGVISDWSKSVEVDFTYQMELVPVRLASTDGKTGLFQFKVVNPSSALDGKWYFIELRGYDANGNEYWPYDYPREFLGYSFAPEAGTTHEATFDGAGFQYLYWHYASGYVTDIRARIYAMYGMGTNYTSDEVEVSQVSFRRSR